MGRCVAGIEYIKMLSLSLKLGSQILTFFSFLFFSFHCLFLPVTDKTAIMAHRAKTTEWSKGRTVPC